MYPRTLPYLLLLPAAIILCVFFLYPFLLVAWQAMFTDNGEFTSKYFAEMVGHWTVSYTHLTLPTILLV